MQLLIRLIEVIRRLPPRPDVESTLMRHWLHAVVKILNGIAGIAPALIDNGLVDALRKVTSDDDAWDLFRRALLASLGGTSAELSGQELHLVAETVGVSVDAVAGALETAVGLAGICRER